MNACPALLIPSLLFLSLASAADWPQWRGPQRNAISTENVTTKWPADGPKVLWRAKVGTGFSSIAIAGEKVYTMGNSTEQDTVWCFDARKGKSLWHHTYAAKLGPVYYEGGPGSTPTVNNNRVYTIGKWGDVFCFDAAMGTIIWQHDLSKDGVKSNRWGFAGSPLIWNDLVIFNAGSEGVALDRNTGRTVWLNGTQPTGYASPTLFEAGGATSLLIFAAKHLVAVEPKTGRELWRFPWETGYDTNNPDPLVHRNTVFISSYSRGCALLEVNNNQPRAIYSSKVLHNHLSPGVLIGDHLYAFNGEAKEQTDFRCVHLPTGEVKWTRKDPAMGSLICANGNLLLLSEKGELLVGAASPTEFKPLSRAHVLGGLCWTPPALSDGLLYVRNAKGDLVCLDLKPGS